jgi:hypothetical protein
MLLKKMDQDKIILITARSTELLVLNKRNLLLNLLVIIAIVYLIYISLIDSRKKY